MPENNLAIYAAVATIAFGVYLVIWLGFELFFNPLRKIPGPFLSRFTRLWEVWLMSRGQYNERMIALHDKYGEYVRLAPKRTSCTSPDTISAVYALGTGYSKSVTYDGANNPNRQSLFATRDVQDHAKRKRKIGSLYSMSTVVHYEKAVEKMIEVFHSKCLDYAKERRMINLPTFLQAYAFDVIGEITFGRQFGFMEAEKDTTGLMKIVEGIMTYQNWVPFIPELHPMVVRIGKVFRVQPPAIVIDTLIKEAIERHRTVTFQKKEDAKSMPFVAKVLEMEREGKANYSNVFDGCSPNIVAGSDSTSAALSATVYYIYHDPKVLATLRHEIDSLANEGKLSDPVTYYEANAMPYLNAVIKEALRIAPPSGHLLGREVPAQGVTFDSYYFPAKTEIGANAWALHYNSRYVEEPRKFKPDRFLQEGNLDSRTRVAMNFAFGAGSRACIGRNISLLEMTKLIPQLVRNFDIEFEDPTKPLQPSTNTWFVTHHYTCRVAPRASA